MLAAGCGVWLCCIPNANSVSCRLATNTFCNTFIVCDRNGNCQAAANRGIVARLSARAKTRRRFSAIQEDKKEKLLQEMSFLTYSIAAASVAAIKTPLKPLQCAEDWLQMVEIGGKTVPFNTLKGLSSDGKVRRRTRPTAPTAPTPPARKYVLPNCIATGRFSYLSPSNSFFYLVVFL